jgi:hypothetical protein
MGSKQQQSRFQWLRQREEAGELTQSEQTELMQLLEEMDRAEAAPLQASAAWEEADCQRLEAQNAELETLVRRQEALVRKLERFFAAAEAERHAIEVEKSRILSTSGAASGPRLG